MKIVFIDATAPSPYDAETLKTKPQGGTESTVTRVAEALAKAGHEVHVAQHCRTEVTEGAARYIPFSELPDKAHAAVALRVPELVPTIIEKYPDASRLLWCHDLNQQDLVRRYSLLHCSNVKILGVSRWHKTQIVDALLSQIRDIKGVTVSHVYNPVDDCLKPETVSVDLNKLVFFSSPHKGLKYVLEVFQRLHLANPAYRLFIANPGYIPSEDVSMAGVENLGPLCHDSVLSHVRGAHAVLYPNTVFPETFGLVLAEAAAVGTPTVAHNFGAASEVLCPSNELVMDCRDPEKVVERVLKWRNEGRPQVRCKDEFRMSNVLRAWEALLS